VAVQAAPPAGRPDGFNLGEEGQVSYHYKLEHWDEFEGVPELEYAPKWDGHDGADTVTRLLAWS